MDFHALQRKLFEMDPVDPRDDLRKLQQSVKQVEISETVDYLKESVQVAKGSLPLEIGSLNDFAALAGIRLDETKHKTGPAGQAKGSDPMPKAKPGRTKHPLQGKLVGGGESIEEAPFDSFAKGFQAAQPGGALGPDSAERAMKGIVEPSDKPKTNDKSQPTKIKGSVSPQQLNRLLGVNDPGSFTQAIQKIKQPGGQKLTLTQQAALADAFVKIMAMDPQKTTQIMQLLKRVEAESIEEKKNPEPPKQRNPVAAYAQKSGAGVHKDQNKKNIPPRKEKYKSKSLQYESIKDRLWEALNRNK